MIKSEWKNMFKNRSYLGKASHIGSIIGIVSIMMFVIFIIAIPALEIIGFLPHDLNRNERWAYFLINWTIVSFLTLSPFYGVETLYWLKVIKKTIREFICCIRKDKGMKERMQQKQNMNEYDSIILFILTQLLYGFLISIILLVSYLDNSISINQAICMAFIYCMATGKAQELLLSIPVKGKHGINKLVNPSLGYIVYTFKWFKEIEYPIENI